MLDNLQALATGQGPLFWGAAAAAALGASLLAAALLLQLRRPRAGRARPRRRFQPVMRLRLPRLALFGRRPAAPGVARPVPGGYAPARPGQPAAAPAPAAEAPDLDLLLARLRRASDRLAALQAPAADSRRKGTPARTDHLYRRGVG